MNSMPLVRNVWVIGTDRWDGETQRKEMLYDCTLHPFMVTWLCLGTDMWLLTCWSCRVFDDCAYMDLCMEWGSLCVFVFQCWACIPTLDMLKVRFIHVSKLLSRFTHYNEYVFRERKRCRCFLVHYIMIIVQIHIDQCCSLWHPV